MRRIDCDHGRQRATAATIGALSRAAGVKVTTIRYYESVGLMPTAARTGSNRRAYGPQDMRRLRFIRHARDLGFEVAAIRRLLDLADRPAAACGDAHAIAAAHLAEVEDKIARLTALREELSRMIACDSGRVADCRIVAALADHGMCLHDNH